MSKSLDFETYDVTVSQVFEFKFWGKNCKFGIYNCNYFITRSNLNYYGVN